MAKLDLNVLAKKSDDQNYVVVEFKGEIDKSNIADIRGVLANFVEDFTDKALIFDMTYFDFINSEGVGLVASLFYKAQKKDQFLFIVNPQPQVADVFNLIGLNNVTEFLSSVDEAVAKIS